MGGCVVDLEEVEAQMCLFIMACQLAPWKQCVCLYLIPQWGLYFHFPFLFIFVRDHHLLVFLGMQFCLLILFNFPKLLSNWGRLLPPKRMLKQQIFGHSSLINNWEVGFEGNEGDGFWGGLAGLRSFWRSSGIVYPQQGTKMGVITVNSWGN